MKNRLRTKLYLVNENKRTKIKYFFSNDEQLCDKLDSGMSIDEIRKCFFVEDEFYIIRKISNRILAKFFELSDNLKESFLEVVGYFITEKEQPYLISKVGSPVWSFSIVGKKINLEDLEPKHKQRLSDLLIERLILIYSKGFSVPKFDINDVYFNNKKLVYAPRLVGRKRFDYFCSNLRDLFLLGISKEEDIFYALTLSLEIFKNNFKKIDSREEVALEKVHRTIIK